MKRTIFILLASGCSQLLFALLNVPVTVKNPVNLALTQYPVTVMVPLPAGGYQNADNFRLLNGSGTAVPAQFNPILRNVFRDNSLRFVQVIFKADLAARGTAAFTLTDGGAGPAPAEAVVVSESGNIVTVNTGALKFTIRKNAFNLFNRVWLMPGDLLIADSTASQGGIFKTERGDQLFQDRTVDAFAVEENGPMRAVVRVESYTLSTDSVNGRPGFIFRLYAYAGSRYVKVDAALVNGERTTWGWPIYFKDFSMRTPLVLSGPTVRFGRPASTPSAALGQGKRLVQWGTDAWRLYDGSTAVDSAAEKLPGWFDVSDATKGLMVSERFFWHAYPNGFGVDAQGVFSASPWPETQYFTTAWYSWAMNPDTLDLYWLDDMHACRKEYLYYFHGAGETDAALTTLNRAFQWPPVASVPLSWHGSCRTTLEFGGYLPDTIMTPAAMPDTLAWVASNFDLTNANYAFGWANFRSDRRYVCDVGSWPRSTAAFLITGSPGHYFDAELWALGDLNLRRVWCPGWNYEVNQNTSGMARVNYCSGIWRSTAMEYYMRREPPHRAGTYGVSWGARDFEHLWTYNIEEFYHYSGDPWIRDAMNFWCEYFKTYSIKYMTDSTYGSATRGVGHSLASYLMAMRITNKNEYLGFAQSWVRKIYNRMTRYPKHSVPNGEGPFQLEFLDRALASYMQMVEGSNSVEWQRAFQVLWGHAEWNTYYANYCYYWQDTSTLVNLADTTPGGSGGSFADAMAYMAFLTQHRPFVKNLKQVWNPGNSMYFNTTRWNGDWMGRWTIGWSDEFRNRPGLDTVPPAAVSDLSASVTDSGLVLSWSAPATATHYHAVWGLKPVKEGPDTVHLDTLKWWAAQPGGVLGSAKAAGQTEAFFMGLPIMDTVVYVAVRSFDSLNNISAISNVFSIRARILQDRAEKSGPVLAEPFRAFPNPFNSSLTIRGLAGSRGEVRLYGVNGRLLRSWDTDGKKAFLVWNGRDRLGRAVPSQVLVLQYLAQGKRFVRKVVYAR